MVTSVDEVRELQTGCAAKCCCAQPLDLVASVAASSSKLVIERISDAPGGLTLPGMTWTRLLARHHVRFDQSYL